MPTTSLAPSQTELKKSVSAANTDTSLSTTSKTPITLDSISGARFKEITPALAENTEDTKLTKQQVEDFFSHQNRAERRRAGKRFHVKIPGANKPYMKPRQKTIREIIKEENENV